jgi:hypothetical protein
MLIASQIENSAIRRVMIEMRIVIKKIHLAMCVESAKLAYRTLSSKLLRWGEIAEPPKK